MRLDMVITINVQFINKLEALKIKTKGEQGNPSNSICNDVILLYVDAGSGYR